MKPNKRRLPLSLGCDVKLSDQQIEILLAEDNPADASFLKQSFLHSHLPYRVHIVQDGEAALAFLRQNGFYAGTPRPHLIILDIGLPKRGGWDVLTAIRADPSLTTMPVVMLTGILTSEDTKQSKALRPIECLVKPTNLTGYQNLIATLAKLIRSE